MTRLVEGKLKNITCPNEKKHTQCPSGYMSWHIWAEEKAKTHKQIKCPGCGLYKIWIKK